MPASQPAPLRHQALSHCSLGSNSNGDFCVPPRGDGVVFLPRLWTIYASREKAALVYRAGRQGRTDRLENEFGLA